MLSTPIHLIHNEQIFPLIQILIIWSLVC